jgi:hypothetical protein
MNKLIFTLSTLFISSCALAQSGYIFLPTENQYWNKATKYTWITGSGDLANPVKVTWYWEEKMITIKDLNFALLKDEVFFIQELDKSEKDITVIQTTNGSVIIIDVVRKQELIVVTIMSPDKSTPLNENGEIVIQYGKRFLIPLNKEHASFIY